MPSHLSFTPTLGASLPAGWFAKESITLLAPDGQANVIASSEPLHPDITSAVYADVQGGLLRHEFPGYREFGFEPFDVFGSRPGYLRRFEWTPPDGVPVTQIQLYYVCGARGYTATATTPSSSFPRYEDVLVDILADLSLEAAGA